MCWQTCDSDSVDCGAGCAADQGTCAFVTANMVYAPLMAAFSIYTMGVASVPANTAKAVAIGTKTVAYTTKTGYAMAKMASAMQSLTNLGVKLGKFYKRIKTAVSVVFAVAGVVYKGATVFSHLYAQNFAALTSEEINSALDRNLQPKDALYIKGLWASITFQEISEADGWNIAKTGLDAGSVFDPTGISGVVAAYANPKCLDVIPFPDLNALNIPPKASCQDVQIKADLQSSCEGSVPADLVGAKSIDPDSKEPLTFSLSGGPLTVNGSPHTVTVTVKDRDSRSDTCVAKITVTDPTEAVVACPTAISKGTDPGSCRTVVTYSDPAVTDNCQKRSQLMRTGGLISGSEFPLGETQNTYQVTTFPGGAVSFCNFNVNIRDVEPPTISCNGLATTLNTEPGLCTALHSYLEPVGTDNCENDFDPDEFAAGVYVVQTKGSIQAQGQPFPLGTTTNTYEASDNEGNSAQCSFDIVVIDEERPSISCPKSIVIAAIEFCDKALVQYTVPNATDNCSVKNVVLTNGQQSGTYFPLGVTKVTWTATDGSGNQESCSFEVSVVEDLDGDRIKDCVDNCPTVYNPDQSDADLDKIGDACDVILCNNCWPGTSGPCRQSDSVCRGLSRGYCPVGTRPCQTTPLPQCSMCSPGTRGPCQGTNKVCWDKLSSGKCPTGTTECRPQ